MTTTMDDVAAEVLGKHGDKRKPVPTKKARADEGLVCVADVAAERVQWLWFPRIPLGKLTVIDGDPGLGKSTMTLDIAARVTTGREMPDGPGILPGDVLFCTAEDGLADTVRPRLEVAGAELRRAHVLLTVPSEAGEPRPPSLPEDVDHIGRIVRARNVRLVVIDPLMAFLGAAVDSHQDKDVRRALHPLARMAEDTGAAVVLVRHLNKGTSGNALYKGGGSIGIIGAARSGLIVARDPNDATKRVLATTKCNIAAEPPSLSYEVETANDVGRIRWHGESPHRAEKLVAAPLDVDERTARNDAVAFLERYLNDAGGAAPVADVTKAFRAAGLGSERTLQRARTQLGVRFARKTFGGGYTWALPAADERGGEESRHVTRGEHAGRGEHGFQRGENGSLARQPALLASLPAHELGDGSSPIDGEVNGSWHDAPEEITLR